jgi:bifunctional DNA-binding transcriptional regulator/antitoxin component of YhaV-PrlF toxin-antitoxin module
MYQSIVIAERQTTLPKPFREALEVEAGDTLRYIISEGTVQVLRLRSVAELAGMLARDGQALISLDDMDDAIAQGEIESC